MPGPRQSLEVLEGNGRKHLSQKEKAERAEATVDVPKPEKILMPAYLPKNLRKGYKKLAEQLREVGLFTDLDVDTLARYVLAQHSYELATTELLAAQHGTKSDEGEETPASVDIELVDQLSRIQERFAKQCRSLAGDMGLTVTSRCRLVLPPGAGGKEPDENPFERMMREREERRQRA